jgi:hypothetical protein
MGLALPFDTMLAEAEEAAQLAKLHAKELAAVGIPKKAAPRMEELIASIRSRPRRAERAPRLRDRVAKARALVVEISSALFTLAKLRRDEQLEAGLTRLRAENASTKTSASALIFTLRMWTLTAEDHRKALDGFGGFDLAVLDEARAMIEELGSLKSLRDEAANARRALLSARDTDLEELTTLLRDLRVAARFVFRDRPEIARQFTSAHARKAKRARASKPHVSE